MPLYLVKKTNIEAKTNATSPLKNNTNCEKPHQSNYFIQEMLKKILNNLD